MKSEPESRIENGVDVKVKPFFCACVHCFVLFCLYVCLQNFNFKQKYNIQQCNHKWKSIPTTWKKHASVNQNYDIESHTYDTMSAF